MTPQKVLHRVFVAASRGNTEALGLVSSNSTLQRIYASWEDSRKVALALDEVTEARTRYRRMEMQFSVLHKDLKDLGKDRRDPFSADFLENLGRVIESSREFLESASALRGFLI